MLIEVVRDGMRRLGGRDRWEVVGFLRQNPEANAYLLGIVARDGLYREAIGGVFVGHYADGALTGLVSIGANLVLSDPCSLDAVAGFAAFAREAAYASRVIIGPDAVVDRFMARFGRRRAGVALERPGQLLYRVDDAQLAWTDPCPELRPADVRELDRLIRADLAMVAEELGFDPFSHDIVGFRSGWLRRLREERSWVIGRLGHAPTFKVDQSAVADEVIQLAGIYTAPAARRRGIARRAVGAMCRILLEEVPVVTLYVHRDNTPAQRLYESLGFEAVGEVRSVWLYP